MSEFNELEQKLIQLTAKHLGIKPEEVSSDSKFSEDLGADSLTLTELVMAMEDEFNCEIPDEDAAKMTTVAEAAKYLQQNHLTQK